MKTPDPSVDHEKNLKLVLFLIIVLAFVALDHLAKLSTPDREDVHDGGKA